MGGVRSEEKVSGWAAGTYEEVVADGERGGLVGTEVVEVVRLARERGVDMVHDGFRDFGCLWMGRAS